MVDTQLEDIRTSLNETARIARSNLLFLLAVSAFMTILAANANDVVLLKSGTIELPLMQLGIPVTTFYVMAPLAYLLLLINLLLRMDRLVQIGSHLKLRIHQFNQSQKTIQSLQIFPLDLLQIIFHDKRRPIHTILLGIVVVSTVILLPISLFIYLQLRFLPYQNDMITLIHQLALTTYILSLSSLITRVVIVLKNTSELYTFTSSTKRIRIMVFSLTTTTLFPVLIFAWCVAVVPGSKLENQLGMKDVSAFVFRDWWHERYRKAPHIPQYFKRYLYVPGKTIAQEKPPPELLAIEIRKNTHSNEVWSNVAPLDLTGRSLRYGVFDQSRFMRATFNGASLAGARFYRAEFYDVDMELAVMHDVNLVAARLHGANMRGSELLGADLRIAQLHGANLGVAFHNEKPVVTNLSGADLRGTELYGSSMNGALLYGVNMSRAHLYGANLTGAKILGANMENVFVAGANLDALEFNLVNTRFINSEVPSNSNEVRHKIVHALRYRDEVRYTLMKKSTSEKIESHLSSIDRALKHSWKYIRPALPRHLDYQICVWSDSDGSFSKWPEPGESCSRELANLACSEKWIMEGVLRAFGKKMLGGRELDASTFFSYAREHCPDMAFHGEVVLCEQLERNDMQMSRILAQRMPGPGRCDDQRNAVTQWNNGNVEYP